MSQLLSVDDCHVAFGAVSALRGVSLRLDEGDALGVVGPLTAGKTTLLRVIAGLVAPDRGHVAFEGRDLASWSPDARARAGIIHVPATGGIFPSLTVQENLMLAQPADGGADALRYVTELFPVLGERLRQRAGSLSGGEQRQLAIARGALATPSLLLLDEPLLGLSPVTVQRVATLLRALREQRVSLVIVEERPTEELRSLVDRVIGLRAGRVVPAQDVEQESAVHTAAAGTLDRVDVEMVALPLSTRDRRALQTIAQQRETTVGALLAELAHQHVETQQEVWQ